MAADVEPWEPAAVAGDLALWLADNAKLALPQLHAGLCEWLAARGIPVWRSALGLELLHPERGGVRSSWVADEAVTLSDAARGMETSPAYLNSPVRVIDETNEPFRARLEGSEPLTMPLLQEHRDAGATDYAVFPFPFLDTTRSAFISFVSRRPGGFSDAEFATLAQVARLLSPYAERRTLRRIAIDLLDTYVGHYAGERIYQGQITRGATETIGAAVLMCDMRGFTTLSSRAPLPEVIATLNAWFDAIAVAVEAEDGEILKFMGDGMLAIFRAGVDTREACARAYRAAQAVRAGIDAVNAGEERAGSPPIEFAMGLHVGDVAYGNVGGRHRLDFTVLGPAVNYASRLQDLAKHEGQVVLTSAAFADCAPAALAPFGAHPLRGIGEAEAVFTFPQ